MGKSFIEIEPKNKAQMMAMRTALLDYASDMVKNMRSGDNDSEELDCLLKDTRRCLVLVENIKQTAEKGEWFVLDMDDIELYVDALSYVCNDQVLYCKAMLDTIGPLSKYWQWVEGC